MDVYEGLYLGEFAGKIQMCYKGRCIQAFRVDLKRCQNGYRELGKGDRSMGGKWGH